MGLFNRNIELASIKTASVCFLILILSIISKEAFSQNCPDTTYQPTGDCATSYHRVIHQLYFTDLMGKGQSFQTSGYNDCCESYAHFGNQGFQFTKGIPVELDADLNEDEPSACPSLDNSNNNPAMAIWIDWNGNGAYDSFERVYVSPTGNAVDVGNRDEIRGDDFTIPDSAVTGLVSMRVMGGADNSSIDSSDFNDPCQFPSSANSYEYEDYTIEILPAPSCPPISNVFAKNIKVNEATIKWDSTSSNASWQVQWGKENFNLGNGKDSTLTNDDSLVISNLNAQTKYDVYVRQICGSNDTSLWSLKTTFQTACGVKSYPYSENFDSLSKGWQASSSFDNCGDGINKCWNRFPVDCGNGNDLFWGIRQGTTGSSSTGPDGDHTSGSGQYLFTEASNPSNYGSDTAWIKTPSIDLSNASNPILQFYYHMFGADMGDLDVEVSTDFGQSWNNIFTQSGQAQSSSSAPWTKVENSLGNYSGDTIQIRFIHSNPTDYEADAAIDDVTIGSCFSPDSLTTSNITDSSVNVGWDTAGTYANQWKISWDTAGYNPLTGGNTSIVNDTSFSIKGLEGATQYDFYVASVCGNNDTTEWKGPNSFITECGTIETAPYKENFDQVVNGWQSGNGGDNCGDAIDPCWMRVPSDCGAGDDFFWGVRQGGTSSGSTGPDGDHTTGNDQYIYTEASNPSSYNNDTAWIKTPEVALTNLSNAELTFFYHMYGTDIGTLDIDVSTDGGQSWTNEYSRTGADQSSNGAPWNPDRVDLSSYVGDTVQIRFMHSDPSSYDADVAIDDVKIFERTSVDLALTEILKPQASTCGSSITETSVVITNRGADTVNQVQVGLNYTGALDTSLTETFSTDLATFENDTFTFSYAFNSSQGGSYNLEVINQRTDDSNKNNDTLNNSILIDSVPSAPAVINDSVCYGNSATLVAQHSSSNANFGWYDGEGPNAQSLAVGDTFNTAPYLGNDTFYVEVLPGQVSPITITEVELGSTDEIEVQNILDQPFDASGWFVAISDDYSDINDVNNDVWQLDSFQAQEIKFRDDNSGGGQYWGSNILWNNGSNGWAAVVDDKGNVRDFVVWGYSASDVQSFNTTVNSTSISVSSNQWTGDGTISCSSSSIQRIGNFDSNDSSDFTCARNNVDSVNPNFNLPGIDPGSISSWSCPSDRIGVSPELINSGFDKLMPVTPFTGTQNTGLSFDPDVLCSGDTATYEIQPPQGSSNADHGSDWSIDSIIIETENGYKPSDTLIQYPSGSNNAKVRFVPTSNELDSLITITAQVRRGKSCDTILERYIQVSGQVNADFAVEDKCADSTVFLDQSHPQNANLAADWNFGDGNSDTGNKVTHVYNNIPGTYQVKLQVTGGGCSDQITKTVDIKEKLEADFGFTGQGCQFQTLDFNDSSVYNGSGSYTQLWRFGNGDTLNQSSPSYDYDQIGEYDVELKVDADNGCKDSVIRKVNVKAGPDVGFGIEGTCANEAFSFIDSTSIEGNVPLTYEWRFPNSNDNTQGNVTHTFDSAGDKDVTLKVSASNGCTDSVAKTVTVSPVPQVDFESFTGCVDEDVRFLDNTTYSGNESFNFKWYFGNGDSSAYANPDYSYDEPGYYQVSHVVSTVSSGCTDTVFDSIEVYAYPQPDFGYTNSCVGTTVDFSNETSIESGNENALSYSWDFDGNFSSSQENPDYQFADTGNYQVTLEVTYRGECTDTITKSVNVRENPEASFNVLNSCAGQLTQFEFTSGNADSYEWDFGQGTTDTVKNPELVFDTTGTYQVSVIAGFGGGSCYDTASQSVTINAAPEADFEMPDTSCEGQGFKLSNRSTENGADVSYEWDFGNGEISNQDEPVHTYGDSGSYEVKLFADGQNGCTDSMTKTIQVKPSPEADFEISNLTGNTYQFYPVDSSYADYQWDFGDGNSKNGLTPVNEYESTDEYEVTLIVTNAVGCTDTAIRIIDVTTGIGQSVNDREVIEVYPNPFEEVTTIHYQLAEANQVDLEVFTPTGKKVVSKSHNKQYSGQYSFEFAPEGMNSNAGVYFVRLRIGDEVFFDRIVKIR